MRRSIRGWTRAGALWACAVGGVPTVGLANPLIHDYEAPVGFLRIGPESQRLIPRTERGFTLALPDDPAGTRGVVVFTQRGRVALEYPWAEGSLEAMATARQLAVLHLSTGDPLDFYFGDVPHEVCLSIEAALSANAVPTRRLFLAGLSLAGTRALRLAIHLREHPEAHDLNVAGVAVVDAPLDLARLWRAEVRARETRFHPGATDEGRWVTYLLETHLGGTPDTAAEAYARASPYSHDLPGGGAAATLVPIPVRAYHEPDVNWWIENRRKDYYSMNSIDLAALINQLKILGSERAELVTTSTRGTRLTREETPHSWKIVDEAELLDWFVAQLP
ncbi:MAG: hypothetical protein DHS20C21_17770 [Gemmatimonadota bacterium]|nr:MAG: hypothetical protein DHS20C21_17770 [Gemmatimonadota bacterium]